jgi:hypothetical protein
MNFQYQIYGLSVNSSRKIGVLDEKQDLITDLSACWTTDISETPDAALHWHEVITNSLRARDRITYFKAQTAEGVYHKLRFVTDYGGFDVIISPAKDRLWMIYSADEPASNLDSYFIGAVLGCVLRLRGILCLHASVVRIQDMAVVFLGRKKSGKSTTAAALARHGYKVMADDIAAITTINNQFYVYPGYPKVRLRPKSLAVLHPGPQEQFASVHSHRDSRYSDILEHFWETPLPLGAIYILGETVNDNDTPFVEPVNAGGMVDLHSNTFGNYIITPDLRKQEFEELARIAMNIPIRRLHFGRNVELVDLQCTAIINDFLLLKKY